MDLLIEIVSHLYHLNVISLSMMLHLRMLYVLIQFFSHSHYLKKWNSESERLQNICAGNKSNQKIS